MAGLISADSHANEVPATWERVQKQYGDRAPRVVWNPTEGREGPYLVVEGGSTHPHYDSCANVFQGMVIGGLGLGVRSGVGRESTVAAEFHKNFRFEEWPGPWEPGARLKDMDRDGVDVDVIYPSHLRHIYQLSENDEPFFRAIAQSYNEWLLEMCSHSPKRLVGLPVLSVLDVRGAVEDLEGYARRGAKGFMIASSVPVGMSYGDAIFDPLWAAAQDAGVPLCMHTTSGRWKQVKFAHPKVSAFVRGGGEIQATLMELIYGGVFDRFPSLKMVAAEWDVGWVAHMVGRLNDFDARSGLKLAPSEYLRRNVWFTFENDRAGMLTIPMYGADNFLWGSDYPHAATTWPDSQAIVDQQCEGIPEGIKQKVVRENIARLYNLDL